METYFDFQLRTSQFVCVRLDLREIPAVKRSGVEGRRVAGMGSVWRRVQLTTSACKSDLLCYLKGDPD